MFGASVGLILLSPLLACIWLAVRVTSPGPAIYTQYRTGHGGRPFRMYKFRSMVVNAEEQKESLKQFNEQDGPAFKIKHDPRITRLGKLLRKTSMDELPQFWNVLRGEMSLVGPRPLPCDEADGCTAWQRRRTEVLPGLTCLWQIKGRSVIEFAQWVRMDIQYLQKLSFWSDLKILLLTVPCVLFGKGR